MKTYKQHIKNDNNVVTPYYKLCKPINTYQNLKQAKHMYQKCINTYKAQTTNINNKKRQTKYAGQR